MDICFICKINLLFSEVFKREVYVEEIIVNSNKRKISNVIFKRFSKENVCSGCAFKIDRKNNNGELLVNLAVILIWISLFYIVMLD